MSQLDPWSAVAAERRPQTEHDAAGLVERHLIVRLLCTVPPKRFVEGASPGKIVHAERDETDPLLHQTNRVSRC
jgi:hypothetical protein